MWLKGPKLYGFNNHNLIFLSILPVNKKWSSSYFIFIFHFPIKKSIYKERCRRQNFTELYKFKIIKRKSWMDMLNFPRLSEKM